MLSFPWMKFYLKCLIFYIIAQTATIFLIKHSKHRLEFNNDGVFEVFKNLSLFLRDNVETDQSGMYNIFHCNPIVKADSTLKLTLVSQCSSNHLHLIPDLFYYWKGPMSIAVFAVGDIQQILWQLAVILHCFGHRIQLHLVMPTYENFEVNFKYGKKMLSMLGKKGICLPVKFDHVKSKRNYEWNPAYPINLLRNVAKIGTRTDYIFVIDIDMIPSYDLYEGFVEFISNHIVEPKNVALVVPTFEIKMENFVPRTINDLREAISENLIRQFYQIPCFHCHSLTDYDKWMNYDKTLGISIMYYVNWKYPWEPFFIIHRNSSNYDERFKQYGMNRVSQLCELFMSGYKFGILGNAFLVHLGFKTRTNFHRTKGIDMLNNKKLYKKFIAELKYKYPNSTRRC